MLAPSFFGGGSRMAAMIARWSIRRGRPDRSWSANPAMPACHAITVLRVVPTFTAISVLECPQRPVARSAPAGPVGSARSLSCLSTGASLTARTPGYH